MKIFTAGQIVGWVILGVVVIVLALLVFWVIGTYNKLVVGRNKVKNSWSQIEVQLKRRFDMIPNLVETVKGFATQEKDIFMEFAKARKMFSEGSSSGNVEEMAKANAMLSRSIAVVVEQYPQLKSDQSFLKLQDTLQDTENKVAFSRQFYNDVVLSFNNMREVFPSNIVAGIFKFKEAQLFKLDEEEEAKAPKIKF
ncbi:MAG: LemA family protein [Bacilli bacterium]|jgi:LemA protein